MKLNPEQEAAVADGDWQNTLIVAGPGTGKTTVLVEKIAQVLTAGANPDKVVVITFTNAAADSMRERLGERMPEADLFHVGTLHSFCLKILRSDGASLGLPPSFSVIDDEQAEELLQRLKFEHQYIGAMSKVKKDIQSIITTATTVTAFEGGKSENLAWAYLREMLRCGMLSYDAILYYGCKVIAAAAWAKAGSWPEWLFVDEFQDSGELDCLVYSMLPGANRFFVGDPDQAIYGFRGGSIQHILRLSHNPNWRLRILQGNYRSSPCICDAATVLIEHNVQRVPKTVQPANRTMGSMAIKRFDSEGQEKAYVAGLLKSVKSGETSAVLCRTNKLVEQFAAALEDEGLNVRRPDRWDSPKDWDTAKKFVALLANPDNDIIARHFLAKHHGARYAEEKAIAAMEAGQSINAAVLKMPYDVLPKDIPDIFRRVNLTPESIALVKEHVELLVRTNSIATLADLSLAMCQDIIRPKEMADPSQVHVMTIHKAKGLEWDNVHVVGLDEEVTPGAKVGEQLEEERRLVFVAVTRARTLLTVSGARSRRNPYTGAVEPHSTSRFIDEVDVF